MADIKTGKTREQILICAATLFSRQGYRGVSTREIARMAKVNEITIYRYYPRKQDLFVAALEAELEKMRLHPGLVAELAGATNLKASLRGIFELITEALVRTPHLARLVQFSILEFGAALLPLCRKRLGSFFDLSLQSLERWVEPGEIHGEDSRMLVLAFAATIVSMPTLYPAIWNEKMPLDHGKKLSGFYAEAWYPALKERIKPVQE